MLIQTEVGRAEVVAKQLSALAGVVSAEYVTGPYDVRTPSSWATVIQELPATAPAKVTRPAAIARTGA
mgnify:CR=1 FL=1